MTGPLPRILAVALFLCSSSLSPCGAQGEPIDQAGLEWQLLGRSVARIHTPDRVGTGFLISNECLLTSGRLIEGVSPRQIEVYFADPLDETGTAGVGPILSDRWRALSVNFIPLDGCAPGAIIHLAPKAGLYAGEEYGYLGARRDDPMPGETAHFIAFGADGYKTYVRADALYDAGVGLSDTGGPLSFCYQSDVHEAGDGAPVLGDGGCLIGFQCTSSRGQAWAININGLRQAMPDGGCPLEVCQLEVEREFQFDSIGSTPRGVGGMTGAYGHDNEPRVNTGGSGGSSSAGSLRGLSGGGAAPFDFPETPPGTRDLDPPTPPSPDDAPPARPRPPQPPHDTPRVPEPGSLLLLLCGAAVCGRRWMR